MRGNKEEYKKKSVLPDNARDKRIIALFDSHYNFRNTAKGLKENKKVAYEDESQ